MSLASGLVLATATIAALAGGFLVGGRNRSWAMGLATAALGLILLKGWFRFHPGLEFVWLDTGWYTDIRPLWVMPAGVLIFSIGVRLAESFVIRSLSFLFALLAALYLFGALYTTAFSDLSGFLGQPDRRGYCPQTTPISCGAAAAATWLTLRGFPTTEAEMAERCVTNSFTGTDELALVRGLRGRLASRPASGTIEVGRGTPTGDVPSGGFVLRVETADWAGLCRAGKPVLATTRFSLFIDHWVVVLRTDAQNLVLYDPLAGETRMRREDFLGLWRGVMVNLVGEPIPTSAGKAPGLMAE